MPVLAHNNTVDFDYDMVLVNLPMSDLMVIPTAPAILKGIAEKKEFKIKTHDFNVDVLKTICKSNYDQFKNFQNYFLTTGPHSQELQDQVKQFYNLCIDFLAQHRTRYVGISVFSVYTHIATLELCQIISGRFPEWKIVLGGKGLTTTPYVSIWNQLTGAEKIMQFYQIMMKRQLVHHTIIGDAEDALVEFLDGQSQLPGQWQQASNTTLQYPFSNFDDYDFDGYKGLLSRIQLPVISSKGCVRSCDFCDVAAQFSRFQSKDGGRLAEEIIYLNDRYNIKEFALTDSIANGNMKSLRACLEVLANHNQFLPVDQRIEINGNWISRPPGAIKPEFFDLMARAGFLSTTIGAEAGSDHVLEAMDKKTTVAGLFYEIDHMKRVGIKSIINNIIGHWSERYQDFLEHLDMILKLGPYIANRTVTALYLGMGFSTLHNTPADQQREKNKLITSNDNFSLLWYTPLNPNLTLKTRLSRWVTIYKMCFDLNLPVYSSNVFAGYLLTRLQESYEQSKHFVENHVDYDNYSICPSVALVDNWQPYVEQRIQQLFPSTKLHLVVESNHCLGAPRLFVRYNGKMLYHNELPQGCSTVDIVLNYNFENPSLLEIGMDNKKQSDTQVDTQGQIIADKNILLKQIEIDDIDIMKNMEYFYHRLEHIDNGAKLSVGRPGFFSNGQINVEFRAPYWQWYIKNQLSNTMDWQPFNDIAQSHDLIDDIKSYIYKYEY
jgi:radical SAM superfamily enzyme YgiQ (UPF0313 family)